MGGDKGPVTTIEGIYKASKIFPKVHFRLFGDKQKSFDELNKLVHLKTLSSFILMKLSNQKMDLLML